MASNIQKLFKTNAECETKGIWLDYGDFRIRIARAGGANKAFAKCLEKKSRPLRRLIQADMLENEQAEKLMGEVYAESVVLGWEGVTDDKNKAIPFSKDACLELFKEMPDLLRDIMDQAGKMALFREDIREAAAKN